MEPTTHRHRLLPPPVERIPPPQPGPPDGAPRATTGTSVGGGSATTDSVGRYGEALAARHLTDDDGLTILARNWRISDGELRGELDIVAHAPDGTLVVVEVKTRRDADRFGGALEALTPRQAGRLRGLTGAFLRAAQVRVSAVRLDLIAIDLGREAMLTHVESAL
jgi:putative endonuclease